MKSISEENMQSFVEEKADIYYKQYRKQIEALESHSLLSKVRSIRPWDIYALGQRFENWNWYRNWCEAEGSLSQLGKIPQVALDVITVNYGSSPMSVIASDQPIDDETGIVHFKDIIARDTRGNLTAGDTLWSPDDNWTNVPADYAGDYLNENVGSTAATVLSYGFTLANAPLRPYKVEVTIPTLGLRAIDDGNGVLLGNGIYGTINYTTGGITIDLAADPAGVEAIYVAYNTDFEESADIPGIQFKLRNKMVHARVWALKDTVGLLQSFAMERRLGTVAADEIAADLVSAINMEKMNAAIGIIKANAVGNNTYYTVPSSGVSLFEHKQSYKDALAAADSTLNGNAGRGTITAIVAGRKHCQVMETLPGFTKISDGADIGPHIFGMLDGKVIVRVSQESVLPALDAYPIYKGQTPFEAPLVHSVFMPLMVTTALPTGDNPLLNQKAAADWSALTSLVPKFSTKVTAVETAAP